VPEARPEATTLVMAAASEPPPSAATLIARAAALRPLLVEQQAETEARTYYSESTHQAFLDAGFYRMFVPRRFGGYEVDLPTFYQVIMEIARGCPSTAWCLCLGSGHSLQVGAWFGERAQAELFGDGDFRCVAVGAPAGSARPTADGWELSGTWSYGSGAPYATHLMGHTFADDGTANGASRRSLLFIAPRSEWRMLDDWGDTLGLRGSGSQSIEIDRGRIPDDFVLEGISMVDVDVSGGTPGSRLHGNPLYGGRTTSFFQGELSAIMIGAVRGAIDAYQELLMTRATPLPPIVPRRSDPEYQRWLGSALARVETAEAALVRMAQRYMELCRRNVEGAEPFSRKDDLLLGAVGREAMTLAWDVMHGIVFRTAGTSAARSGHRIERVFRDMAMGWGHLASVMGDWALRELGREHLGETLATPPHLRGDSTGAVLDELCNAGFLERTGDVWRLPGAAVDPGGQVPAETAES